MKKIQESAKKDTRVMDSFVKKVWMFIIVAMMFPAFGAFAQTQDNMQKNKNTKQDTSKTKTTKDMNKSSRTRTTMDTTTNQQQQNLNNQQYQQNQNQNQQNRNRYDTQKGDTLKNDQSRDAVLIENNPKK